MTTPGGPGAPQAPDADDRAWAPRDPSPGPARPPAPTVELVAGYHDFAVVARGGDSVVYRARQDVPDREVAVKVVLLDDPDTKARFERELAITVRLGRQHPHIVTVLATGVTRDAQPCLVMDFFELGSLHDRLVERGPLPVSEVVTAGSVVADALSFAHGQGVLHRDVKPQNVLVLPTSYVLADFGLARAIDAGHSASLERFSYRHASPQVLDGEAPTVADDVYSLGSTLFTLLDGRAPFAADDPNEDSALTYLRRARVEAPRDLERDDVPPRLREIVYRCLEKDPADRYPDAAALHAALEQVPTETRGWAPDPTAPVPEPEPEPAPEPRPEPTAAPEPEPTAPEPAPVSPPPPEPAPVAVSALAHVSGTTDRPAASHRAADDDATGLRPVETEPAEPPPPSPPRRWPALVALGVIALAAGLFVGLRNTGGSPTAAPTPTPRTSGTPTTPAPTTRVTSTTAYPTPTPIDTGLTSVGAGTVTKDPAIAPRITSITRSGGKVVITLVDRSHGVARIFVIRAGTPPRRVPSGATGITLTGQPAGRQCYALTAFAGGPNDSILSGSTTACTRS